MSKQMLKYIETVSKESWVELQGVVQIPKEKDGGRQPITGTSQQVRPCLKAERREEKLTAMQRIYTLPCDKIRFSQY